MLESNVMDWKVSLLADIVETNKDNRKNTRPRRSPKVLMKFVIQTASLSYWFMSMVKNFKAMVT